MVGTGWESRSFMARRVANHCAPEKTKARNRGASFGDPCNGRSMKLAPRFRAFTEVLIFLVLSNPVDVFFHVVAGLGAEAVFHEERVFAAVFVKAAEYANRLELLFAEEQLSRQIR